MPLAATASAAFKAALDGSGATVVTEEYIPQGTTDFTAATERMFNALKDKEGRKVILIYVAGGGDPMGKIQAMQPERFGIEISTGGHILPVLPTYKQVPGMEGRDLLLLRKPQERDQRLAGHNPSGPL